jgi:hypothetical protein
VVGYLFYYAVPTPPTQPDWMIWAGGQGPGGIATKILWIAEKATAATLHLSGSRLDAAGSFRETFASIRGGTFPSIVVVPQAGCWRLTLRAGRTVVRFAVRATRPG